MATNTKNGIELLVECERVLAELLGPRYVRAVDAEIADRIAQLRAAVEGYLAQLGDVRAYVQARQNAADEDRARKLRELEPHELAAASAFARGRR